MHLSSTVFSWSLLPKIRTEVLSVINGEVNRCWCQIIEKGKNKKNIFCNVLVRKTKGWTQKIEKEDKSRDEK